MWIRMTAAALQGPPQGVTVSCSTTELLGNDVCTLVLLTVFFGALIDNISGIFILR